MAATNNNSNELARVSQQPALTPDLWSLYKEQAKYIAESGLVAGAEKPQQAIVVMLLGLDLGLSPTASLRGIDIIKGKPAIKPQLMAALIVRAGHPRVRVVERSDKQCVLEFRHRDDDQVVTVSYTWAEAQKAGLAGKDNYLKNAADMLYNRCLGRGARQEYPEIFFTVYTADELDYVETTARPVTNEEPVPLHPERNHRLDTADAIREETELETIRDTKGTWASISKEACENALLEMVHSKDFAVVAKTMGITSFKDEVLKRYPEAKGSAQYSALLHLVYEWRESGKTEANATAAAKANAAFDVETTATELPTEEEPDF